MVFSAASTALLLKGSGLIAIDNLQLMNRKDLTNADFWGNLINCLRVLKKSCKSIGISVDFNNLKQEPVLELRTNTFNQNDHQLLRNCDQVEFVPAFTDGSLVNAGPSGAAGSAVVWRIDGNNHWQDRTVGKQTSLNSELFAYEAALSLAPIDKNLIIFTDCLIERRTEIGVTTKFEWVPSHTIDDKPCALTSMKAAQIYSLKETYPDWDKILEGNKKVDEIAKKAMFTRVVLGRVTKGLPEVNMMYNGCPGHSL